MNWKKSQPPLGDEQRISNVTRAIENDSVVSQYVPKRIPTQLAQPSVPTPYADVLEQVRALSVKAVDTYGQKVMEEVRALVLVHLETALNLAGREQEINDHYLSEMNALKKDVNDFTSVARQDLEHLGGLAPSKSAPNITEAVKRIVDEQLNGTSDDAA